MSDLAEPTAARLPRWRGENGAPGYCVNLPREPLDLWRSEEAQRLCAHHWAHFAERYRGVPNARLTFNLINEPKQIDDPTYSAVVRTLCEAIRRRDPDRLIIADGLDLGWTPVEGIVDLGVAQSLHAYDPWAVSHWRAPWFTGAETWPEPTWPLRTGDGVLDRATLLDRRIGMWRRLEARGVGVHVGEFGTYKETPHAVTLAWMRTGSTCSTTPAGAGPSGTCAAPTDRSTAGGPTRSTRTTAAIGWIGRCST